MSRRACWSFIQCGVIFATLCASKVEATAGALRAWGNNSYGTLAVPEIESAVAISAAWKHAIALRPDGSVVRWGSEGNSLVPVPGDATNIKAIAAGLYHYVTAKNDGTVFCWGLSTSGQTTPPVGLSGVVAVAAGENFSVALKSNGTVAIWGKWWDGSDTVTPSFSTTPVEVAAISAGGNHLALLKNDGTVQCFGLNNKGQTDVPSDLAGVKAIAAGYEFTAALKSDGSVVVWGSLSTPTQKNFGITAIAAGDTHLVGLKGNGTVVGWGSTYVTAPSDLIDVRGIAAGKDYTLAIVKPCTAPELGDPIFAPGNIVCQGTVVTLTQPATSEFQPVTYQWYKGTEPIEGATGESIQVIPQGAADMWKCVVRSGCGQEVTSSEFTISVNPAPVAPDKVFTRMVGSSYKIPISSIGADITFHAVGQSQQNATILLDHETIYYLPSEGNHNTDQFTYTISNGYCTKSGTITMSVENAVSQVRDVQVVNNEIQILFQGIPSVDYSVEKSASSSFDGIVTTVLTTNAPAGGEFLYSEPLSGQGSGFYRLKH